MYAVRLWSVRHAKGLNAFYRAFEKAIDRAAMRANLRDTDSYLAEWRRAAPVEVSDDLQAEADKKAAELEATFDDAKLKTLVETGGVEAK